VNDIPEMRTGVRTDKIRTVLERRQPTLALVIENVHDTHNFNAMLRSCDATGVQTVHIIYTIEHVPDFIKASSSGAYKWIEVVKHNSVEQCYKVLHDNGFQILATKLDPKAKVLYDNDLTRPTAFVLGNEHRGISDAAAKLADDLCYIPMMGMVESVNVSVAASTCLFEALRQRRAKNMYDTPQLSPEALRSKMLDWLKK
jgi:tRNA (guanosine-2'-O-)-methyltransferase